MDNSIWCIFSVENNYDQPDNNLVVAWIQKPTFKEFCNFFKVVQEPGEDLYDFIQRGGSFITKLSEMYNGDSVKIYGDQDIRFEEIQSGVLVTKNFL